MDFSVFPTAIAPSLTSLGMMMASSVLNEVRLVSGSAVVGSSLSSPSSARLSLLLRHFSGGKESLAPVPTAATASAAAASGSAKGAEIPTRAQFKYFMKIQTRWGDNDIYGHVNNVVYYSYFDTGKSVWPIAGPTSSPFLGCLLTFLSCWVVVNHFLIHQCGLKLGHSPLIGIVAETQCRFHSSLTYPQEIEAGLAVVNIGRSAVTYEVGIFANEGTSPTQLSSATGKFVHVYVDEKSRRPTAIPDDWRSKLQLLQR